MDDNLPVAAVLDVGDGELGNNILFGDVLDELFQPRWGAAQISRVDIAREPVQELCNILPAP